MQIKVKKLVSGAHMPTYGTDFSAGADLYALPGENVLIPKGETRFIRTGLSFEIPEGYAGFVYARSGLSCRQGVAPANKVGVIDADYRGEVRIALYNQSREDFSLQGGERIAQIVFAPVMHVKFEEAEHLSDTARGEGGFGSTGIK